MVPKTSPLVQKLYAFLDSKQKVDALPEIYSTFLKLLAHKRNVSLVAVTVAAVSQLAYMIDAW